MTVKKEIVYFDSPGPQNTEEVLKLALERAKELGIKDIIVASTTGETGAKASEVFKGYNVIVVTHHAGFKSPWETEVREEYRRKIIENGGKVLTCTHALSGVERSIKNKFGLLGPVELIANTLRMMGQGIKVAVEISVMAADAGLIKGDEVICITGTGKGADTAVVIKPAHSNNFFDLEIREIICKPRSSKSTS